MTARDLAEQALRGYLSDPGAARDAAERAYDLAKVERDWPVAALAQRALGLVAGHLSDSGAAAEHLRRAVRLAIRGGDREATAAARSDLAYVLMRQGKGRAALEQVEQARSLLPLAKSGELLMMQAMLLKSLGWWEAALDIYRQALPGVRAAGDPQVLARLLGNRGVLQLYRGQLVAAERDLLEADLLLGELGQDLHRAITLHNLGYLSALRGKVPAALAYYQQAEDGYLRHREAPPELWRDQCELLLDSGLAAEARAAAEKAVDAAARRQEAAELAEAQLRLAQAAALQGDSETAGLFAATAARAFTAQRRPGWSALASWAALEATLAFDPARVTDAQLRRAAVRLDRAGWTARALEARLQSARLALGRGRATRAEADLELVSAARVRGPVWNRHLGWHAEALLRRNRGDVPGALRAAARGLALVDDYRAGLGTTDLRAGASARSAVLAALGFQLALKHCRPPTILQWAERTRATSMLKPAALPLGDGPLDGALSQLRRVMSQRREATEQSRPEGDLVSQQVVLESLIRQRTRTAMAGAGESRRPRFASTEELTELLGNAALVEYAVSECRVWAITLVDGRVRVHSLGSAESLDREMHHLFFALRRVATVGGRLDSLEASASRLDTAVLRPLATTLGGRSLVIIPVDPLHATPWSLLPSCRNQPISVSPSATAWRSAAKTLTTPTQERRRRLLVAGPGLVHAEAEIQALSVIYPEAQVLTGPAATASAVLAAMEGADLVHVAGHGRFRSDNPQFSALDLFDGPLTVYDLERLDVVPRRVVLSACEAGRSIPVVGGELLGLASALLAIGVQSLVAPLLHIRDAETVPLMLDLHRALAAGTSMAVALSHATEQARHRAAVDVATASAFVSFGAS